MNHTFKTIVIVEDSPSLRETLALALSNTQCTVRSCGTVTEFRDLSRTTVPDLIFMDFDLPDGNAFDILSDVELTAPMPVIVGMSGVASPDQTFRLGERGVRAYLQKPFDLARVVEICHAVQQTPPKIAPFVRGLVGHSPIPEVECEVRAIMVGEAMARANGSRRGAAKLLSVSRQTLQHILRKGDADVHATMQRPAACGAQRWCMTGSTSRRNVGKSRPDQG